MAPVTLVQHKHCPVCGKAILPSRTTCDEGDCELRFARIQTNRKWFWRGWFVASSLIILLVIYTQM